MIHEHFTDLAKVVGVNIAAFSFSLSGFETTIRISGLIVALVYTLLKILDWISERRERKAKAKAIDPVIPIVLMMIFSGCAGPKQRVLDVARPLERASVSVARAERHLDAAKTKITDAKGAAKELERTATAEQKPHVLVLTGALADTERLHAELSSELTFARNFVSETQSALDVLGAAYEKEKARREKAEAKARKLVLLNAGMAAIACGCAAWVLLPSLLGINKLYAVAGASAAGAGITYLIL